MSYCRFSSLDGGCDVYCYHAIHGGYVTMIAACSVPECTGIPDTPQGWADLEASLVPLDKPLAGQAFHDDTLTAFRDRLVELRALGYRFPDAVFARIDHELTTSPLR